MLMYDTINSDLARNLTLQSYPAARHPFLADVLSSLLAPERLGAAHTAPDDAATPDSASHKVQRPVPMRSALSAPQ